MILLVEFNRFCGPNKVQELVSINPEHIVAVCEHRPMGSEVIGARIMLSSGASIDVMETRAEIQAAMDALIVDEEEPEQPNPKFEYLRN